jgi:5-methylcytosine-specific restriction enzyme A
MSTFLFTWNPNRSPWKELPKEAIETAAGTAVPSRWSCGVTKKISVGDRVFLVRLGVEPKGIIASGWVTKAPYLDEHWEFEKAQSGKQSLFVLCEWERLLDPDIDSPLTVQKLLSEGLGSVRWTPQASGVEIPQSATGELEKMWAVHVGNSSLGSAASDEEIAAVEGALRIALVRHRRREQKLREAKIAQATKAGAGLLCCEVPGCGFNFSAVYGDIGSGYAQVHHLKQLSELASPTTTTLNDLAVVCANCHAMIHRGGGCRSLNGLIQAK